MATHVQQTYKHKSEGREGLSTNKKETRTGNKRGRKKRRGERKARGGGQTNDTETKETGIKTLNNYDLSI